MISQTDIDDMTDERAEIARAACALDETLPEAVRHAQDALDEALKINMTYRNWRGEVAQRTIRPVVLWFGKTDWHPEPGWLLNAWDCDKGERRDFALADCQFADPALPPQHMAGDEMVRRLALRAFTVVEWVVGEGVALPPPHEDADDLLLDMASALGVEDSHAAQDALAEMDTPKGGGDE